MSALLQQFVLSFKRKLGANVPAAAAVQLALFTAIALVALVGSANGQSIPSGSTTGPATVAPQGSAADVQHRDERYKLCASDIISVAFPLTPEFNQTISIGPDGFAALSGAGNVRLIGMTTDEATSTIRSAYGKLLHDPIVTVELKDYNKPFFVVTGQVNKPGKYDLRGNTLATEAVAEAGGFNNAAKHSQVLLFRRVNDKWYEVRPLNLKRILAGHNLDEDAEIRSGDLLFVPKSFASKIARFIPSSGVGAYYQLHP